MRIMFQPDALHHQAPSNHTRHHHTLSGPPEKTSGFNIPNAPTASLHAARCTLHAQLTTTRPQLSVKLSLLPSRHDTASPPFPTQTPCPPFLSSPPLPPTLHTFAALHLQPRATSGCRQPSPILLRDTRSRDTTNTSHFPHTSLATSLPATSLPATSLPTTSLPATSLPATSLPATSTPATSTPATSTPATSTSATSTPATSTSATSTPPPRPKPSTAASMHSHIGPRPTRIQRFLHMPPTQPH